MKREMRIHWRDQYERMKRWRVRAKGPRVNSEDRETYNIRVLDELSAFFTSCNHLRDWLIEDSEHPIEKTRMNGIVSRSEPLSLCRDLANASKHAVLEGGLLGRDSPRYSCRRRGERVNS